MKIAMVGLGKMGANMAQRLIEHGHEVVAFDLSEDARAGAAAFGAQPVATLDELVAALEPPRVAWVMVPAGKPTNDTITALAGLFSPGDVVIDGGNSNYKETAPLVDALSDQGIALVDAGTSGGIWGLKEGYCLMVGGTKEAVAVCEPAFLALAPEGGYAHVGPPGAGHFVKMVHNGIEYGMMAAYAEGLNIIHNADAGTRQRDADAETSPLEHPEYYRYDIDTAEVAEVWRRGSVVASWLLDLTAEALHASPGLEEFAGRVSDSGEGRWTSIAAIEVGVPAPVLTTALYSRFASRNEDEFANKVLSAMRKGFGGHDEKSA